MKTNEMPRMNNKNNELKSSDRINKKRTRKGSIYDEIKYKKVKKNDAIMYKKKEEKCKKIDGRNKKYIMRDKEIRKGN